jgi:hypothetical protein
MIPFSIWSYVKPAITTQQKRKKIIHDSHVFSPRPLQNQEFL